MSDVLIDESGLKPKKNGIFYFVTVAILGWITIGHISVFGSILGRRMAYVFKMEPLHQVMIGEVCAWLTFLIGMWILTNTIIKQRPNAIIFLVVLLVISQIFMSWINSFMPITMSPTAAYSQNSYHNSYVNLLLRPFLLASVWVKYIILLFMLLRLKKSDFEL